MFVFKKTLIAFLLFPILFSVFSLIACDKKLEKPILDIAVADNVTQMSYIPQYTKEIRPMFSKFDANLCTITKHNFSLFSAKKPIYTDGDLPDRYEDIEHGEAVEMLQSKIELDDNDFVIEPGIIEGDYSFNINLNIETKNYADSVFSFPVSLHIGYRNIVLPTVA
jgi:hypothetical protein